MEPQKKNFTTENTEKKNVDALVKSRHSGENRSPDGLSANALWRT
jgi:hypothetical protein